VHDYVILDVFTDVPLEGNQLAVFTDARSVSDTVMQRAARELNLSETVFVLPAEDRADAWIRIFTPVSELPFAGHPTLGSAFVVGQRLGLPAVRLQTGAGVVPVTLTREHEQIVYGEMEQPIPTVELFARADQLLAALGVERAELPVEAYRNGPVHVYVALADEAAVASLAPDLGALARVGEIGVSCFAVGEAGAAGDAVRVKTRMFAPSLGVAEDPATGSAAGPLAVHLARHGRIAYGEAIEIRQGAEIGRPSLLRARVEGSAERIEKVIVGGRAVLVAQGAYRLE
jgi:trans-2,3-dihydro-3-hydroxyanthranilate isomerase